MSFNTVVRPPVLPSARCEGGSTAFRYARTGECISPEQLYARADLTDSVFCKAAYVGDDGSSILKICDISSKNGLNTKDLFEKEVEHAIEAASSGVGPKIYDYGIDGDYGYISMERLECSLKDIFDAFDRVLQEKSIQGRVSELFDSLRKRAGERDASYYSRLPYLPIEYKAALVDRDEFVPTTKFMLEFLVFMKVILTKVSTNFTILAKKDIYHMDLHSENVMINFDFHSKKYASSTVFFIDFGEVLTELGAEWTPRVTKEDSHETKVFYTMHQALVASTLPIRQEIDDFLENVGFLYPEKIRSTMVVLRTALLETLYGKRETPSSNPANLVDRYEECRARHFPKDESKDAPAQLLKVIKQTRTGAIDPYDPTIDEYLQALGEVQNEQLATLVHYVQKTDLPTGWKMTIAGPLRDRALQFLRQNYPENLSRDSLTETDVVNVFKKTLQTKVANGEPGIDAYIRDMAEWCLNYEEMRGDVRRRNFRSHRKKQK